MFLLVLQSVSRAGGNERGPTFFNGYLDLLLGLMGASLFTIFTRSLGLGNAIGLDGGNIIKTFTSIYAKVSIDPTLFGGGITYRGRLAIHALGTRSLKFEVATILYKARAFFVDRRLSICFGRCSTPLSVLVWFKWDSRDSFGYDSGPFGESFTTTTSSFREQVPEGPSFSVVSKFGDVVSIDMLAIVWRTSRATRRVVSLPVSTLPR